MFLIKKLENPTQEEINCILDIWLNSNIEAHRFIPKDYWLNNYDDVKSALPKAELLVSYDLETITGFLGLIDGYIAGIFVKSKYRSLGIGGKLLDAAREHNNKLVLNVYSKNIKAIEFYSNNGFKKVKESIDPETNEPEYQFIWMKK